MTLLKGIRVLDFGRYVAGPYCATLLGYLGADVIRIETTKRLCISRTLPPFADGIAGPNRAPLFNEWNPGKRSILLNLSNPQAIEIARDLARHCDVAVENFAPGVIRKMGLGYEDLRKSRPDLIMLSLSGYGQTGPYTPYVNYGPLTGAVSGLFQALRYGPSEEPWELTAEVSGRS